MIETPVAIIGAGPYGLSLAAHLGAQGIAHRIFGEPMQFWSRIAAAGGERYLKSFCFGTNLSAPRRGFTFADYSAPRGLETFEPCAMRDFASYGLWFQHGNVPWVERTQVSHVAAVAPGRRFLVTLETGERLLSRCVIVATGLAGFAHTPGGLGGLAPEWLTHTGDIASFDRYRGQRVAVIGAGQSALEAAALISESGGRPHLIVRETRLRWHSRAVPATGLRSLRSPLSNLGSGPKAWVLSNFPGLMHGVPDLVRARFTAKYLPAEGAWWLRNRVEGKVPVSYETSVRAARVDAGAVRLELETSRDGTRDTLSVDHVIAGSGYKIDVARLAFLDAGLAASIARIGGSPRLNAAFETSVAGLYFVGPASVLSFGPLFRFVAGADHAARAITAHVAARMAPAAEFATEVAA